MKKLLLTHKDLLLKIEQIEKKLSSHDESIQAIFSYLKQLLHQEQEPRKEVGFKVKK